MTSCSKGAWGLFVLSRGLGILTETAISPSTWSRQCPSRYAIRAGRNLPDKEFRYLRTVIVTAAVYRGFGSELRRLPPLPLPLTFRHRAGVSVYTAPYAAWHTPVFLLNSRLGRFTATQISLRREASHLPCAPLLPKLRGQYAEFLDHVSLVHLRLLASPTCVGLRYGRPHSSPAGFSRVSTPGRSLRGCPPLSHSALGLRLPRWTAIHKAAGPSFHGPLRFQRNTDGAGIF